MISRYTLINILREFAISTERAVVREDDIANSSKILFNVYWEIIQ